jgi:hypothetical protein
MLCDRLSDVEDTTSTILRHLRRQEMSKPFGRLDTDLLGLPLRFPIFLEREQFGQKPFEVDISNRPYVEACAVKVDFIDDPCTPEHFHSFYRKTYPQHAERMVEIEKNWEDDTGLAQCKTFGIKSVYPDVFVEVTKQLMCSALDAASFADVTLVTGIISDGWILHSRHEATIAEHIVQNVRLLQSVGIDKESVARMTIAPCAVKAANLFRLGQCFKHAEESDREEYRKEAARTVGARDVKYLEHHPLLNYGEMYDKLAEALNMPLV